MPTSKTQLRRDGFTFKQFFVAHDRCAMKVGTDGILLGAWAPVAGVKRILDIGTGSGLIALMLAQRTSDALIDAVEMDPRRPNRLRKMRRPRPGPTVSMFIRRISYPGPRMRPIAMT